MRRLFLVSFLAIVLVLGVSGTSSALYIETIDVYQYSVGGTIGFNHTYDFSETTPYDFVTLTIVADDVDGPSNSLPTGENDHVYVNGTYVGDLEQLPEYTNWNYHPGAGNPEQGVTTTVFNLDPSLLSATIPISIDIETAWGAEIETSTLTVQGAPVPEPATLLLLGAGLLGIAGIRVRKH